MGSCPVPFTYDNCKFNPILKVVDNCGDTYEDPNDVLVQNFMSYRNPCRDAFTPMQIDVMHNTILGKSYEGVLEEICESDPMMYFGGSKKDWIVEGQTLIGFDNILIENCTVYLKNSTIEIGDGGNITLGDANLVLDNSKIVPVSLDNCISGDFGGIISADDPLYLGFGHRCSTT